MNRLDSVFDIVADEMKVVEKTLLAHVGSDIDQINSICSYVFKSGGKRLRPLILLLAARCCGYQGDSHITVACVMEYIHTATLLHDDVIDHAEIRRGNSSANILWGNQSTILSGDFLFAKAFSLAVSIHDIEVLDIIAETCSRLAEAEMMQVIKAGDPRITEQEYFTIITDKTASLFSACTRIGGILGRVSGEKVKAVERYGHHFGIAFQIMDDVLDYSAREEDLGKTIGKDLQEGSITLPFIAALERSSPQDRDCLLNAFGPGSVSPENLSRIIKIVEHYKGSDYAVARARDHVQHAIDALEAFKDRDAVQPLIDLAKYVVERTS